MNEAIHQAIGALAGRQIRCRYVSNGQYATQDARAAPRQLSLSTAEKREIRNDPAVREVLSLFGGVIGVTLGLAVAASITTGMSIPFVWDPSIVLIAFGFSALVGIVFGYFPARRAAQLNPIEALRHE